MHSATETTFKLSYITGKSQVGSSQTVRPVRNVVMIAVARCTPEADRPITVGAVAFCIARIEPTSAVRWAPWSKSIGSAQTQDASRVPRVSVLPFLKASATPCAMQGPNSARLWKCGAASGPAPTTARRSRTEDLSDGFIKASCWPV